MNAEVDDSALVKTSQQTIRFMLVLVIMSGPTVQATEIYRWVDKDGKVHFTDQKPDTASAEKVTVDPPDVGEPDEGELRRRTLIKQAEADFKLKQKQAEEAQAKEFDDDMAQQSLIYRRWEHAQ